MLGGRRGRSNSRRSKSWLILTVTRACNLRCSYCPTVKEGWPSLTEQDVVQAIDLFADRYGGGDIKLFGGEPLLEPDAVRAALRHALNRPEIGRVFLSTNGLGLDRQWLKTITENPKAVLTVSMDGRPEDHRRFRRVLPVANACTSVADETPDAYDHIVQLLPELLKTPRVVVTQTIPPATAKDMFDNFAHLLSLGFWRFNLLPGYYLPWSDTQLAFLKEGFAQVARAITERWERGDQLYLRNLFTWAPTPFFNTGLVVDADRTIHPSNVGLSGALEDLLQQTQVGTLACPPTPSELRRATQRTNALLQKALSPHVWSSTLAVDAALTEFCQQLYPAFVSHRSGVSYGSRPEDAA